MQDTNGKNQGNLPFSKAKEYPEEFKLSIVNRVLAGKSALSLSKEVGVAQTTISRWVQTYKATPGVNGKMDQLSEKDKVIDSLQSQNEYLQARVKRLEKIVLGYVEQIPVNQLTQLLHAEEEAS